MQRKRKAGNNKDKRKNNREVVQIPNVLPSNSYLYIQKDYNFCLFETINYSQNVIELIEKYLDRGNRENELN